MPLNSTESTLRSQLYASPVVNKNIHATGYAKKTIRYRSPGCSTAIESLISALTARVLQLYIRSRAYTADVFTTVTRKICNYCRMNIIIWSGRGRGGRIISMISRNRPGRTNYSATSISLGEMLTFRSRLRWKKVVAPIYRSGLLVQTDLGHLECTPPCARVGSGRQTQANCDYDERMSDGNI